MTNIEIKRKKRLRRGRIVLIGTLISASLIVVPGIGIFVVYAVAREHTLVMFSILNVSVVLAFAIGLFTVIIPSLIWQIDLVEPEEAHKDNLNFSSYDEFLNHTKDYFASVGYVPLSDLIYGISGDFTVYHNFTSKVSLSLRGSVHTVVYIIEMEKFSEEVLKSFKLDIKYIGGQVRGIGGYSLSPYDSLYIFNVHNVDEEFFDYFNRNPMVDGASTVGGILIAGLSFEEKSLYIQKQLSGKGMVGYKKMLPLFCNLMQIETPNFRNKKKKVKE